MNSIKLFWTAVFLLSLYCTSFTASLNLDSNCFYLKNSHFEEYLYSSSSESAIDSNTNRVFTWRRKSDGPATSWGFTWGDHHKYQGLWLFEKKKTACKDCYTIKSLYYEDAEPLYSVSSRDQNYKLINPRRPVYTYRGKHSFPGNRGEDIWKIETVSDYSDRVRIKNKNDDDKKYEYLYATDDRVHDDKRRNVFTWSSNENLNVNRWDGVGDWILEKAECPSYAKEERY